MKYQSAVLEQVPEASQHTKEAISAYQQTVVLKCQDKVDRVIL